MYKLTQHNRQLVTLNSVQACLRYIGLHKTIQQAIKEGFRINKVEV